MSSHTKTLSNLHFKVKCTVLIFMYQIGIFSQLEIKLLIHCVRTSVKVETELYDQSISKPYLLLSSDKISM